jgi:hypothetical protein
MPISRIPGAGLDTGSSGVAPSNLSTGAPSWDGSGNLSFNSGYGSTAVAYGCRAWVNFNGTANTNLSGTYSQSGTTVTVTATAHGLIAGNVIYADITTGTGVDGTYTVATVTDANTFTYTAGTSLTTSGNITLVRNTIRASGNVSSIADNSTGNYHINFTTAMPDTNYAIIGMNDINTATGIKPLTYSTGSCRIETALYNSTPYDTTFNNVAIFR